MLGERYFRRAYRMPYKSFRRLHSILAPRILGARLKAHQYLPKGERIGRRGGRYKLLPIRNGRMLSIPTMLRFLSLGKFQTFSGLKSGGAW